MKAEYGEDWPKRVAFKPPWEIDKVFVCLAQHWFAICDESAPDSIRKAASRLKSIFQKGWFIVYTRTFFQKFSKLHFPPL